MNFTDCDKKIIENENLPHLIVYVCIQLYPLYLYSQPSSTLSSNNVSIQVL